MPTEEVDAHHICVSSGLQFLINVYSPPKGRLLNIFHWVIEQYKIVWEFFPSHYRGLALGFGYNHNGDRITPCGNEILSAFILRLLMTYFDNGMHITTRGKICFNGDF